MPFINTKVSVQLTPEKEEAIKTKLGEAITLIGKSEGWLMLGFEDNCRLWFKGYNSTPLAFVDVALLGKASGAQYDKMTAAITQIISDELGIAPNGIYVKYEEASTWGWNGGNL